MLTLKGEIVKVLLFLLGISVFISSCSRNRDDIKQLIFFYNMPAFDVNQGLKNVNDIFYIFYYKDYVLYKLPYIEIAREKNGKVRHLTKYNFFLCKKGLPTGEYFNSLSMAGVSMPVDSLLKNRAFKGFSYSLGKYHTLATCSKNSESYDQVCKYSLKSKPNDSYPDSTFLYFSDKLKGFDLSLSPKIEQEAGYRLAKIVLHYNSVNSKEHKVNIPERNVVFEIRPSKGVVPSEIRSFIIQKCEK